MTANEIEIPADLIATLRAARTAIEQWKEIESFARKEVELLLGDAEVGTADGVVAVRWTRLKSTRLDQTLVKALHPAVYAECQTVSESRRFTITDADA